MIDRVITDLQDKGVSPVIGVILMVAIVVVLAAVIGIYAVELSDSTSSNVNSGVQVDETSEGVQVQWTSSGNAERVYVVVDGSEVENAELTGVGETLTVSAGANDTVSVIGVDSDGNESEIQSVTTESDTTGGSGSPELVSSSSESGSSGSEPNSESGSVALTDLDGDGSSSNPYVITNDQELQAMNNDLSANYVLGNDIDASLTNEWNSGSGFNRVGDRSTPFTGNFNGDGYTISGLTIDDSGTNAVGLFGAVENSSSTVQNVTLESVDVTGNDLVGGLVGDGSGVTISNVSVSGSVTGGADVGMIVGTMTQSTVIENSSSDGTVSGSYTAGGLSGYLNTSTIVNSSSSADVSATNTGAGGAIGQISEDSEIKNSYATGNVSGGNTIGGLIGRTYGSATVSNTYATGTVSGDADLGGLVGEYENDLTVQNSYWDTESTGQSTSPNDGTGLTTSEMQGSNAESNMSGFDFSSVWTTTSGGYPELQNNSE